ncbi:hypothetical protein [Aporhodopirellula aestuarii]|uniref:Transmembrane protein n=1 Tax=Aporhodopirellula aestuarii TaxID=2950107 RepID=A0ABT0U5S9_9BACT|nr:hypothetical protein [Aporhodopirellula aestuarii]MCM2372275.1 hypothetical protein [Aporhodopirellula aestuarii]
MIDRCLVLALAALVWTGASFSNLHAQGPGTLPPPGLFEESDPWPEQLQGIRPDAFFFQDESSTPVVMSRMSFEEIDRLRKLDQGMRSGDRVATLERLTIDGVVEPTRAHWDAELIVRLEPAAVSELAGRSVVFDIGFSGAHLLEAAEVRFVHENRAGDGNDEAHGARIPGAYVRLPPPSQFTVRGRAILPGDAADAPSLTSPLVGSAAETPSLPSPFPSPLRQAIGMQQDAWNEEGGGYQLVLPSESVLDESTTTRESPLVSVKLKMSARLWATPPRQTWLPIQLPAVPTRMQMQLQPEGKGSATIASLDVVGSGREVVRRIGTSNVFVVECDGGVIALRWMTSSGPSGDTGDLIEVESETKLQWESPTEPPSMDVRLMARNLRGPLSGCVIRLPAAAVLVSPPEVIAAITDGRDVTSSGAASGMVEASLWDISIARSGDVNGAEPPATQKKNAAELSGENDGAVPATKITVRWAGGADNRPPSTVRLRLQLRQFPPEATAAEPWVLTVPQVAGAIGHRGQVTIRTASDHRLRWRPRLGVDAVVSQQASEQNGELVYPFRFTQTRFELPVWLSGKQRQVRLTGEAELQVTRRAARVQIDLRAGSGGFDPKGLRLEPGAWRLLGITTDNRAAALDISTSGDLVEWQVDTPDGKWPEQYRITAELLASAATADFKSLVLPRIISTDSSTILSDVQLTVLDGRRESWLVDLAESPTLQRIPGQAESKFRILSPESPWSLSGSFASRPLQLQWSGDVSITQSSNRWLTRSVWTVTSPLDLEGRLRFTLPAVDAESGVPGSTSKNAAGSTVGGGENATKPDGNEAESADGSLLGDLDPDASGAADSLHNASMWLATVDGGPAIVRSTGDSASGEFAGNRTFEIVSPQLDSGTHRIELVFHQPIVVPPKVRDPNSLSDVPDNRGEIASLIALPSPAADQVDLKSPLRLEMPMGVADSAGLFWRVLPESDGVLANLRDAARFDWKVDPISGAADGADLAQRSNLWTFNIIPDFPIPVVLRSRVGEERLTEIPRSFLRSLVGKQFRHEHLLATVRGGRRVRLGLPVRLQTIRVEVLLDGQPVASIRDASGLRIDLPETNSFMSSGPDTVFPTMSSSVSSAETGDAARGESNDAQGRSDIHLLDVRIWTEEPNNPWWARSEPLIRLPVGSGLQYWQLVVPTDSHLFWASSQSGRAMRWERDRLRMERVPAISDVSLIRWALDLNWQLSDGGSAAFSRDTGVAGPSIAKEMDSSGISDDVSGSDKEAGERAGADMILQAAIRESLSNSTFTVPGNRYLFFAGNVFSFSALTVSRTVLWLAVGGLVLLLASAFQWFPSLHHPLVAFLLALALAGLLVVAPDGVVLTAQLVMISLTLVAVFYAVSAVAVPRTGQRVLQPRPVARDSVVGRGEGSRRGESEQGANKSPSRDSRGGQSETQDFDQRYTPGATDASPSGIPTTSLAKSPQEPPGEGSASRSGVFDVSDPDSSEAVR